MNAPSPCPPDCETGMADLEHALAHQLARQAARWVRHSGGEDSLADCLSQQVERLVTAMSTGHVCLPIEDSALRTRLLASGWVAQAPEPACLPFVLDPDGRFYVHRDYDYEVRLARALFSRSRLPPRFTTWPPELNDLLPRLFPPPRPEVDGQKIAVLQALTHSFTLICGGPGTGKTTTAAYFLACLLHCQPDIRIALTAPTGKAAARMEEALCQSARQLPPGLSRALPDTSFTLHRLLGIDPRSGNPRYHARHPLPFDVVVVDEASMLDLALATRLLEALPETASLLLLGDRDQLASVEKGVVLGALAAGNDFSPEGVPSPESPEHAGCGKQPATPLDACVIHLRQNYRFAKDSGIGQLATAIREGKAEKGLQILDTPSVDLHWHTLPSGPLPTSEHDRLAEAYFPFLDAVHEQRPPEQLHDLLGRYRILTALRHGPRGAADLNREVERRLRARSGVPASDLWFAGRAILVLENEYSLELFNGDIGIALPDENGELRLHFPSQHGQRAPLAPARLPAHAPAWVLTVHKAQGSEFDAVRLVLPETPSRILTRELLYTGVTRARQRLEIIGNPEQIREGIHHSSARTSGLSARLREESEKANAASLLNAGY